MRALLRRLRGAAGNAVVWAAAWFGAGFLFISILNLLRIGNFRIYEGFSLSNALQYSATMAAVGFVTGGVFSIYIGASYRHRTIESLSPPRFALGGGLVATFLALVLLAFSPGFDVLLLTDLTVPVLLASTLGAVTGGGSIKLAQRSLGPDSRPLAELDGDSADEAGSLPFNKR